MVPVFMEFTDKWERQILNKNTQLFNYEKKSKVISEQEDLSNTGKK